MIRHWLWMLTAFVFGIRAAIGAEPGRPQWLEHFTAHAPDSLVQQCELASGTAKPSDAAIETKCRPVPGADAVLLETRAVNRGVQNVSLEEVRLADWTFRLEDAPEGNYAGLTYREDTWYDSTYWTGPNWTRVGKDWHHPGERTPSVRRFTVPRDGQVTISGRVHKAHLDGDGVRASVVHGTRVVWQTELAGKDDRGQDPDLRLDVRRGDRIRFVVHKRGTIGCDTTRWDPVITYSDGTRFQASAGFSTRRQGENGWSYEMEGGVAEAPGTPRVMGWTTDLVLRQEKFAAGASIRWTHETMLPMVFLADGSDRSGIALVALGALAWQWTAVVDGRGVLRVTVSARRPGTAGVLRPGETIEFPALLLAAHRGPWIKAVACVERLLGIKGDSPVVVDTKIGAVAPEALLSHAGSLRTQVATALQRYGQPAGGLEYWTMIQEDWRQADKLSDKAEAYERAIERHLEQARLLLADLRQAGAPGLLAAEAEELERLAGAVGQRQADLVHQQARYVRVRVLKRRIALANPLLEFGKLVFAKHVPTSYSHLVMQYFGWRARPGGGLFVLESPGRSLACRDILQGRLGEGSVLEPRLSYDGRRIVFSFVRCAGRMPQPSRAEDEAEEGYYHVYEVGVDGSGLRQLTRGPYDDLMPNYLPEGGIVFSSTRRRGYARCFGGQFSPRWHVYTLHRMDADGGYVRPLSVHDTNEWFPTVLPSGLVMYARWDYIDRDAVTHQNLWTTRPDGTNPVALWGNATASPHCSFQAQPIPGTQKIVITASAHHSITAGSIAIVDPMVARDGHAAVTRITPEIPFPEAESRKIDEYYVSPWPLSEKYFLVAYSPRPLVWEPGANEADALGLYVLDVFGNRELLYRDPEIGSMCPCPLTPRPAPPVLPSMLPSASADEGEMMVADVYEGLGGVPRGSIRELRVVQIFPKTTHVANSPPIGLAGEENGRAILGTVPVEADGSARFRVPALRPILFQALDQDGFAYQTMRTITYVQPGEEISCVGCHEHRMRAPGNRATLAMTRPASPIEPGELGGRPFSFREVVQPVLEKHCVRCHGGEKIEGRIDLTSTPAQGFTRSYVSLCGERSPVGGGAGPRNVAEPLVPRFRARNTIQVTPPGGMYGALGSRLLMLLRKGHYEVKLSDREWRRLAAWIDLNAIFYGVNRPEDQARQLRGEEVGMPEIQ